MKKSQFFKDEPRFLSAQEIETVLSKISEPQICITELREHVKKEMKTMYAYQLSTLKLRPSKIEKLGDYLANKIDRSFYQAGTPVGFNVSESVSQPATQLTLNAFHSAGQSGQDGFGRFKKNTCFSSYKKKLHRFNMNVHMNDKNYSYEDLYMKAQTLVSISIFDLLDANHIIPEFLPFDDMTPYTPMLKEKAYFEDHGYGVRLHFNVKKLFIHKISLEAIALALEEIKNCQFTTFCGPQILGIIDVYIKPSNFQKNDGKITDEDVKLFRYGTLETHMKNHHVGPFRDISVASVFKHQVTDLILGVSPDYVTNAETGQDAESDDQVRVFINWIVSKKNGIPIEKLIQLLELGGFMVVGKDTHETGEENYLVVKSTTLNIKNELSKSLKKEDMLMRDEYEKNGYIKSTELYMSGYYNVIFTTGSNLQAVRLLPEVDEFNTISDSPMEIYDVLGLEAIRSYLEKEIYDLFFENGSEIAPRNITIMVDYMTSGPRPISFHPSAIKRSYTSFMRAMCFEDPKSAIVKGSVLSTEEPLSNVSARVFFGAPQKLGTGAFDVEPDAKIMKMYDSMNRGGSVPNRLTESTLVDSSSRLLQKPASDLFTASSSDDSFKNDRLSEKDEFDFGL